VCDARDVANYYEAGNKTLIFRLVLPHDK